MEHLRLSVYGTTTVQHGHNYKIYETINYIGFLSAVCYGQRDSIPKPDSVTIIINEVSQFAYDKVTAKDFDMFKNILVAYLRQKEFDKKKKK
jgi:hypothetical protein